MNPGFPVRSATGVFCAGRSAPAVGSASSSLVAGYAEQPFAFGRQVCNQSLQIAGHRLELWKLFDPFLVHVKNAVDLDLKDVDSGFWPSVMFRDVATCIRAVARDIVAEPAQVILNKIGDIGGATGAKAIAEHEIHP